jgi:tetratricopeptide (TPR) repeat protein
VLKPYKKYVTPLMLAALFAACAILYFQSLNYGFVYFDDDVLTAGSFEFISNYKNIPRFFISHVLSSFYRPILILSFSIEAMIFGNLIIGHLTNVLFHIAAVFLIFIFLKKLEFDKTCVFLFSLIFAVHPALVQAVAWIPGRNDSMLAVFSILSFIFLFDWLKSEKRRGINYFLFSLAFFLALFTKETAIVIIAVMPAFMFLFCKPNDKKDLLTAFIAPIFISVLYFALRTAALKYIAIPSASDMVLSLYESFPSVFNYAEYSIIPSRIRLIGYILPFDSLTVCSFIIFTIPLAASVFFNIGRKKIMLFGVFWFVAFLLPTFASPSYYLSHRIYTACIGELIMFLEFWIGLSRKIPAIKKYAVFAALALIAVFAAASNVQIKKFQDRITFLENAAAEEPDAPSIRLKIIELYIEKGMIEKAKEQLDKVKPGNKGKYSSKYWETKAYVCYLENNYHAAQQIFEQLIKIDPGNENALAYLAEIYLIQNRYADAQNFAQKAAQLHRYNAYRKKRYEEIKNIVSLQKRENE